MHASIPSTRVEALAALEALPEASLMAFVDASVYNFWYHDAPKTEKGQPKKVAYGSAAAPFTIADIAALQAASPRKDGAPTPKDTAGAKAKLAAWMAEWEATLPKPAEGEEPMEITTAMRLEAMIKRILTRAAELRGGAYPALVWAYSTDNADPVHNLAMLARAVRLYKGDSL